MAFTAGKGTGSPLLMAFTLGAETFAGRKFRENENREIKGINFRERRNKGRFCNTVASVALVHTSIQSD